MNTGRMGMSDPRQVFGLDRRAVAQAFDRASGSYDVAAALQERVRNELLGRLDELKVEPRSILDLGTGTGHGARALKRRHPGATVIAITSPAVEKVRLDLQEAWRLW